MTLTAQNKELVACMKTMLENQERQQQKLDEMGRQQGFLITQTMSLRQGFMDREDRVVEAITRPTGDFIKAVRRAAAPVRTKQRKPPNPADFPEEQKATQEELRLECRPLPEAMQEALTKPHRTALNFTRTTKTKLTLQTWKSIAGPIGKALKQLRLADPDCEKPLRWSNEGPPVLRYVWSQDELEKYLPQVLDQKVTSAKAKTPETWRQTIERKCREDLDPITWPWPSGSGNHFFPVDT